MNNTLKKVQQSPKVTKHSQILKREKDDNHDSIAGRRKQAHEGMRKSMRNIVAGSGDNEVHDNDVQHAPSAAQHRLEMDQIDVLEVEIQRELEDLD